MLSYFDFFPDKTHTELRTVTFLNDRRKSSIPNGTYVFSEYYCTDPDCECQRVLVKVLRVNDSDTSFDEVATISYTWYEGEEEFWLMVNSETANPFLDPLHRQARYAEELLDFWREMMDRDSAYAARLQRHYQELRAAHPCPDPTAVNGLTVSKPISALVKQRRQSRGRKIGKLPLRRKSR